MIWENPVQGITTIQFGRIFPIFGREWSTRIDRAPFIGYSQVVRILNARDQGIQASGKHQWLSWSLGIFMGDHMGGNDLSGDSGIDLYSRQRADLGRGFSFGANGRFASINAYGLDFGFESSRWQLVLEGVSSQSVTEGYFLAQYNLLLGKDSRGDTEGKLSVLGRIEWLDFGNVGTVGVNWKPVGDQEVKFNFVLVDELSPQYKLQTIFRW